MSRRLLLKRVRFIFLFRILSCSILVSGIKVSAQEDKASPGDQDRK